MKLAVHLGLMATFAAALLLIPGVLRVTGHSGDLVHIIDIANRIADGAVPHRDFMTPLGYLSVAPIGWLVGLGFSPGRAIMLVQALAGFVILLPLWWVAQSRLSGWLRYVFGIAIVILVTAMVHGGSEAAIAISMYYNRWAWAVLFLIVVQVMLPARPGWNRPWVDGLLIGVGLVTLFLLKVTYVAALGPFLLVALFHDRLWRAAGVALLSGALMLALITIIIGDVSVWPAYMGDLMAVSNGSLRTYPGLAFVDVATNPAHITGTLLLLISLILWRKTGAAREGLLLLVLGPGLIFITYQNWGNDPQWLFLLAILLLALRPRLAGRVGFGQPADTVAGVLALVAVSVFSPSMFNLATSNPRHAMLSPEEFTPLFAGSDRAGIELQTQQNFRGGTRSGVDFLPWSPDWPENAEDAPAAATISGEVLPDCQAITGYLGAMRKMMAALDGFPETHGKRILLADALGQLEMFGPFARLDGVAPWYYGGDDGFDAADFVLVPFCPMITSARDEKLRVIAAKNWGLREIGRTDQFILFSRQD